MASIASLGIALALVGCNNKLSDAQDAVAYDLIDPDSAKFREVRETPDGTVCGQVNGKNRMGAYVGFKDFFAVGIGEEWLVTIVDREDEILGDLHHRQFLDQCDPERLQVLDEVETAADEAERAASEVLTD